jgi:hypothetical protein
MIRMNEEQQTVLNEMLSLLTERGYSLAFKVTAQLGPINLDISELWERAGVLITLVPMKVPAGQEEAQDESG